MQPLSIGPVTFAIPFYSGVPFLERALRSIVAQQDECWEAVVIDDGHDDGIGDLVAAIGQGRIKYIRNPENVGMARNFNRCLELVETDLVTVFHCDDELMPGYTGTMRAAAARHPEAAAMFCRAQIIGPDSQPRFSLADRVKEQLSPVRDGDLVLAGEPAVRALLKANFIVAPTLCFRRSRLGGRRFPLEYRFVLDLALTTALLLDGEALVGLSERCYWYRRHEDNETEKLTKTHLRFREESDFYDKIGSIAHARGWDRCVKLAKQKRIIKLNATYRALKSVVLGDLTAARRWRTLLRGL